MPLGLHKASDPADMRADPPHLRAKACAYVSACCCEYRKRESERGGENDKSGRWAFAKDFYGLAA